MLTTLILRASIVLFVASIAGSALAQSVGVPSDQRLEVGYYDDTHVILQLDLDYLMGVSPSMRGNWDDFQNEALRKNDVSRYPFGGDRTGGISIGGHIVYRFRPSNWGAYLGARFGALIALGDFRPQEASMGIGSFSGGAQYFFPLAARFDVIARAGLNLNVIGGDVILDPSGQDTVTVPFTTRMGFELGTGINWKIGNSLLLGLSLEYTDANVIGKHYLPPGSVFNLTSSHDLNDAANPNDPSDHSRTIDFFQIGLTAGVRF